MSDPVLLETERGTTRLYKDHLIHEGQMYLISDMKKAELKTGFMEPTVMLISFKDGAQKSFRVGSVSRSATLTTVFTGFIIDSAGDSIKASTQQWVNAINMLIAINS